MSVSPRFESLDSYLYRMALHPETDKDQFKRDLLENSSTLCASVSRLGRLRNMALDDTNPDATHPEYKKARTAFLKAGVAKSNSAADQALTAQMRTMTRKQLYLQKRGRSGPFESDTLNQLLSELPILPVSMTLTLDADEQNECRNTTKSNLRAANRNAIVVYDVQQTLNNLYLQFIKPAADLVRAVRGPNSNTPVPFHELAQVPNKYALAISLIFASGRRSAEIVNGQSVFTVGTTPYSVYFDGQLKTRNPKVYEIPLLVPAQDFVDALASLRALQNNTPIPNDKVNKSYSTRLNSWAGSLFNASRRLSPHDLRRLWATTAYTLYGYGPESLAEDGSVPNFFSFVEAFLGHSQQDTALHYSNIIAQGIQPVEPLQANRLRLALIEREDARRKHSEFSPLFADK